MTGAETIKGFDRKLMSFRTRPHYCNVGNYNAVSELNLDPKAGRRRWTSRSTPAARSR